mgnify:FL=1
MDDRDTLPPPEDDDAPARDRRRFLLRGGAIAGGLGAFAAGYSGTIGRGLQGLATGSSG